MDPDSFFLFFRPRFSSSGGKTDHKMKSSNDSIFASPCGTASHEAFLVTMRITLSGSTLDGDFGGLPFVGGRPPTEGRPKIVKTRVAGLTSGVDSGNVFQRGGANHWGEWRPPHVTIGLIYYWNFSTPEWWPSHVTTGLIYYWNFRPSLRRGFDPRRKEGLKPMKNRVSGLTSGVDPGNVFSTG